MWHINTSSYTSCHPDCRAILDLDDTDCAFDSFAIDPRLSPFPWARFRKTKAAVKPHVLLDLRGDIPAFDHVSDGKFHDVNILDIITPAPGAFHIMHHACLDFAYLPTLSRLSPTIPQDHQQTFFLQIRKKTTGQFYLSLAPLRDTTSRAAGASVTFLIR